VERALQYAIQRQQHAERARARAAQDAAAEVAHANATLLEAANERLTRALRAAQEANEREAAARAEAERRADELHALFAAMTDCVIVYGSAHRIESANDATSLYFGGDVRGLSPAEFIERVELRFPDGRSVPPDRLPSVRALRGEVVVGERLRARTPSGARSVLVSASPLRNGDAVSRAVVVYRDVTDHDRAEQAVRQSEALYRAIARSIPDAAVAVLDRNLRFVVVEGPLVPRLGLSRDSLEGRTLRELEQATAEAEPLFVQALAGEASELERQRDDVRIWARFVPLRDDAGHVVAAMAVALDVTERRQAEAERERLLQALRDADRRKDHFLAMLSHELRNPLAPIRNSVYILDRAPPGGDQARRAHAVIDRQVHHLTRLVDDLLDVTRINRGKIRLQRQRLELDALVRRAAEDHASVFAQAGVELETRLAGSPVHVNADPTRLAQVIGNLLQNAAKFTPRGGRATLSVEIVAPDVAAIRVRDTGAGVAPEALPHLFEPFVQADTTLDRSRSGLGLGLALVRGIVELHAGTASVRSDGVGAGAEFVVTLPLDAGKSPLLGPATARAPGIARRVLVIEDDADAAQTLKEALELNDHVVAVAGAGPEGIDEARRFVPDVVLCDIGLPGMDGYEVARAMRSDAALRSTHLVALSGYASPDDVERARDAGFDRHVAKPPSFDDLERTLRDVVAGAAATVGDRAP
jgi:PAS domain S-box-containing protein